MAAQWWVDEDWHDAGRHMCMMIYRSGWDYWVYVAEIVGGRCHVLYRVDDTAMTAAQALGRYDLGHPVHNSRIVMPITCGCF